MKTQKESVVRSLIECVYKSKQANSFAISQAMWKVLFEMFTTIPMMEGNLVRTYARNCSDMVYSPKS